MLNIKDLGKAIKQVADEKSLDPEKVIEAIEASLAAAYKREYGTRGEIIKAHLDLKTGALKFWQVKTVVDETTARFSEKREEDEEEGQPAIHDNDDNEIGEDGAPKLPRFNSERHITLEEASKIKSDVKIGEEMTF